MEAGTCITSLCEPERLPACCRCQTYLVASQQLAPPVRLGHVVDGQAQVVVAVFEEQEVGLVDQPTPELTLHLHHLLRGARGDVFDYHSHGGEPSYAKTLETFAAR